VRIPQAVVAGTGCFPEVEKQDTEFISTGVPTAHSRVLPLGEASGGPKGLFPALLPLRL